DPAPGTGHPLPEHRWWRGHRSHRPADHQPAVGGAVDRQGQHRRIQDRPDRDMAARRGGHPRRRRQARLQRGQGGRQEAGRVSGHRRTTTGRASSMKIISCEQGSAEWHLARAGCITASMFHIARSRVGGLTEQQKTYVDAILAGKSEVSAMALAGYKAPPKSETVARALAGEKVGEFSEAAKNYAFRLAIERISGEPLDEGFETWAMRR